ncbi:MAG: phage/plasmid primase, P4 family [Armatimonadota bacterium]
MTEVLHNTSQGGREAPQGNVDAILSHLDGVKRTGAGWMARCPAHDDKNPSLSITETPDRILLNCHAGCSSENVTRAMGLRMRDLFRTPKRPEKRQGQIVACYDYHDAGGKLLYQVVRFQPKDFRQRRPDGAGDWIWDLKGITPVLYQLPRVLEATARGERVFIVEGEKDVHALEALTLAATCNSGGAGKWKPGYADTLSGAQVVILPDNDEPGRRHGQTVAAALQGHAAGVKVIDLPSLPEKGDVSDWLAAGHTRDELLTLVDSTPEWTPQATEPGRTFPLTDLGNAERLVAAHGHVLRRNMTAEAWLRWTGALWQSDETGEVHRLAARVVRGIDREAKLWPDDDRLKVYQHAVKSENAARLEAMLNLAMFLDGIPLTAKDLDRNPYLFNCLNGTLDLKTGRLRPHDPGDLLSKLSPVTYSPEAACPRWEQFLREVFRGDEELVAFLQRLAGYLLTGDTQEQAVFFLVGKGANGKSVLVETLRAMLGDYAKDTPFSTFLERREANTADLASLMGARLVTASEGESGQSFNESLLKRLTGGDTITCRFLYRGFFHYTPTYKVLFATNEVPRIQSQNIAMRRRVKLLPFRQTFYAPEDGKEPLRDDRLRDKLREELPGILAWALRGCLEWQEYGLHSPRVVMEETAALFESFDPLLDFLDEHCVVHPQKSVEVGALWKAYQDWCEANERPPAFRAPHTFSANLKQRDGIDNQRRNRGRMLVGIGLKS